MASQRKTVNLETGKAGATPPPAALSRPGGGPPAAGAAMPSGKGGTGGSTLHMAAGSADRRDEPSGDPSAERLRRQRARSIAIALALGGLIVLFYLATIVRLGGNVFSRSL